MKLMLILLYSILLPSIMLSNDSRKDTEKLENDLIAEILVLDKKENKIKADISKQKTILNNQEIDIKNLEKLEDTVDELLKTLKVDK